MKLCCQNFWCFLYLFLLKNMNFSKYKIFIRVPGHLLKQSFLCRLFPKSFRRHISLLHSTVKFTSVPVITSGLFSMFKKKPVTEEDLLASLKSAVVFIQSDDLDQAEQELKTALQIAKELELLSGLIHVYDVMANLALKRKEFVKAANLFKEELHLFQRNPSKGDAVKVLQLRSKIAFVFLLQGDYMSAQREYEKIIKKIENDMGEYSGFELHELLAQTKKRLGQVQMKSGQYVEAIKSLTDAYEVFEIVYGKRNVEVIVVLRDLSSVCSKVADNSKAIKYLEEAIATAEKLQDDVEMALMKAELGILYLRVELIDKARNLCRDALKLAKKHDNDVAAAKANECLNKIKEYNKNHKS